ncbi:MAG TPA: RIP metalloprotease RseP [Bryobacteraceae bacterium]|nr:RIP metalloprotease RseP [Bryobacteraceae bacterium]
MNYVQNFAQNVWWLLVLIGIMILIHELGHYWAARLFDVRVEAFSFGFGPRLFGFRKGETDFRFSAILFGGYVKMAGEQPGEEGANDPRSFSAKPRWQRLVIAAAGPSMNILLAVGLLTGLFMVRYPRVANYNAPATIGYIQKGSPADNAGLREGDRIVQIDNHTNPIWEDVMFETVTNVNKPILVSVDRNGQRFNTTLTTIADEKSGLGSAGWDEQNDVQIGGILSGMDAEKVGLKRGDILVSLNGQPVRSISRLHELVRSSEGKPVEVTYSRDGQQKAVTIHPAFSNLEAGGGRWMIGVQLDPRVVITQLSFPEALRESAKQNVKGASLIYQFLRGIVERRMSPKSLEGPIRIAQLSGDAARQGPTAFIELMTMVSLNLAIFNLLPIPILDGGMILMLLVEMFMRRDLSAPVKEAVLKVGMVFLMVVVVFVLYNDLSKIL